MVYLAVSIVIDETARRIIAAMLIVKDKIISSLLHQTREKPCHFFVENHGQNLFEKGKLKDKIPCNGGNFVQMSYGFQKFWSIHTALSSF